MNKINYFFEEIERFKYGLPSKRWIASCLSKEGWSIGILNFIFCSDKYLQKVNKKYLGKSYLTDVISFNNPPPNFIKTPNQPVVFGDIFISIDRVKENKKVYKTILANELKRVMIHGALHLIGFNDKTRKERGVMAEKENMYIEVK
jgi:rRNA maturation RNase YbeY